MASDSESAFSVLLQSYRLAAGLTQEDLAERAGLSARGISDLERGLIQRPQARTTRLIAEALGLAAYDRAVFIETARPRAGQRAKAFSPPPLPSGSYLGAVPIGPLIGRQNEVAKMTAIVADVLQGTSHLLLLSGEPGIGKTRLAQEAMLLLRERGFLVATGRCYAAESDAPFYPFLEVLAKFYRAAQDSLRAFISERWPYLARLLPGEGLAVPPAIGDHQDRQRLFRAVTGFVEALAAETPVAILLDDLHWADRSTLALLKHLVRQGQMHRILVLGTHRTLDELSPQALVESTADLRHEDLAEDFALAPLTIEGTADMVRGMLRGASGTDELVRALHARAEGNPFFTQELLRALVDRGDLEHQKGWTEGDAVPELPLPETVRTLVQHRLARLEAGSQDVMVHASVLGQTFRFDDLQALSRKSEEAVEEALEHGRSASLVRIVDRDRYAFNHALVHGAVYASLPPSKRRRLHLAAGLALESLPAQRQAGRASEIARHFREGEDVERTLTWTVVAGNEAAAIFAHKAAARQYRAALELLQEPGVSEGDRHAIERDVLIRLGRELTIVARYDEAKDVLVRAISLSSEADDLEHLARAVAGIAQIHRDRGTPADGIELITPLLTRLEEDGVTRDTGASVYIALANLFFGSGRYDELLWAAERAVTCARQAGNDWILAAAEGRYGLALMQKDRPDDARRVLEGTVVRAEAANNLESLAFALNNLGGLAWNEARLEDQLGYRRRAVEVAERLGDRSFLAVALSHLGGAFMVLGRWGEAREYQTRAMENLQTVGSSAYAQYPYAGLALLECVEGNLEEAIHLAERGLELAERSGDLQATSFLERDLAEVNRLRGRPELSRDRLLTMRDRLGDNHASAARILPALAEAYLALGENEHAKEAADQAIARAAEVKQYLVLIDTLRVRGAVLSRMGQWSEAEAALHEAIDRARALAYPFGLARALDELGQMLAGKGEKQRGAALLDEAQCIYRRLGAAAYYRTFGSN